MVPLRGTEARQGQGIRRMDDWKTGKGLDSVESWQQELLANLYIAERSLATAIYLAVKLDKPLFVEGEAGVGKTEIAKVLAATLGRPLIRLQCYEGLNVSTALYEWNYAQQILQIRLWEASGRLADQDGIFQVQDIFTPEFLLRRPLLQAIDQQEGPPPVLLIDELDRADEEFEAFLLEMLAEFQVTVPELGTIRAPQPPVVVITSNRTREIHDALKRRCLYHWIDYPTLEKEHRIIQARVPEAPERLARLVVEFVHELRKEDLYKLPGVAETIDWLNALVALDQRELDEETVNDTLGALLKYHDDIRQVQGKVSSSILKKLR
jgi:MoxR-like ATPase